MARTRALVAGAALVAAHVAALILIYLLWWPSLLQALQGTHGAFGGGPGMHR